MITLVHFHLRDPIMVGKKKATDIQFYTEARQMLLMHRQYSQPHDVLYHARLPCRRLPHACPGGYAGCASL